MINVQQLQQHAWKAGYDQGWQAGYQWAWQQDWQEGCDPGPHSEQSPGILLFDLNGTLVRRRESGYRTAATGPVSLVRPGIGRLHELQVRQG